jgi:hypothetical protein
MIPAQPIASLLRKAGNRLVRFSERLAPRAAPAPHLNRFLHFFHPGHYYSPLPDPDYVDAHGTRLFDRQVVSLPGIDDNWAGQERLLKELARYGAEFTPSESEAAAKISGDRYFLDNDFFSCLDAFAYYGMLRQYRPKQIVEVGSGFSSALALDVSDKFLRPLPQFTFIEPFPERLRSLLRPDDSNHTVTHESIVQEMSPDLFLKLAAGDFLFIDSSHVTKIGSDVNFLFLEILPRLAPGVIIHIHDVFWPFEYPKAWLDEGRCWNELYLLRGMLSGTDRYRILLFNSQIVQQHAELLKELPPWAKPKNAQSIWLEVR